MVFHLNLQKKDGTATKLSFEALTHPLAVKWKTLLKQMCDQGGAVYFNDRIYNLNDEWDPKKIINRINYCIDTINMYDHFIDYYIKDNHIDQQASNILHSYFEKMRGDQEAPNDFYLNAPKIIRTLIDEFNILIHRMEDLGNPGRIVVNMNSPSYELEDDDYDNFTLDWKPGDIRLGYCHKGKPIWDVFKDNDLVVGDDNIRPQYKYSSDFIPSFNSGPSANAQLAFNLWWDKNKKFLNDLGFTKDDKKTAIGYAVVGKMIGNPDDIKNEIYGSVKIISVTYD
jgi:hypothetical protein